MRRRTPATRVLALLTAWSVAAAPLSMPAPAQAQSLPRGIPVIRVEDADFGGARTLLLGHAHDGRDLQLEQAEKTMAYVHRLWGHEVVLDTVLDGKRTHLTFSERGFSARPVK